MALTVRNKVLSTLTFAILAGAGVGAYFLTQAVDCNSLAALTASCKDEQHCDRFLATVKALGADIRSCAQSVQDDTFDVLSHVPSPEARAYFCNGYAESIKGNAALSEAYHYAFEHSNVSPFAEDAGTAEETDGNTATYYKTMTDCRNIHERHDH